MGEHDERVVERIALGIGARQRWCTIRVDCAQDVVVGENVIEAQVLDRSSELPDGGGIASKLDLRVCDTDLHEQ